ncbi:type I-E CRISPR-associated protein Cas5/CasD [Thermomicrobiaceae bacterium CFH 74404]|uniref:Type I-E CRISPR-associated protein Cas5/CasD n=1 Tax=Thermalbibacter longus TaxID=2951981 RepID=A0AA41WFF0_9BACT|nr:type I-E CRISPR-associated protein Cas5/CasD [Thermalbibacter longus]MCM8749098.1 type I-E CRISPR-associated protein Cas5/CasD [Thermalbibacter longus]
MTASGTLLMRLAGPMQSWGVQSRFTVRDTAREPTKSGVIGLVCAALGRPREESVDDLAELRMGVRVDLEGILSRDYHTAGVGRWAGQPYGVVTVDGKGLRPVPSNRYYLADADFLVGLAGPLPLLEQIAEALKQPRWPLYLGRKSFVPGSPVWIPDGIKPGVDLEAALRSEPWPSAERLARRPMPSPPALRVVLEEPNPERADYAQLDQPLGAAFATRRFGLRYTRTEFWRLGVDVPVREESDDVSFAPDSRSAQS